MANLPRWMCLLLQDFFLSLLPVGLGFVLLAHLSFVVASAYPAMNLTIRMQNIEPSVLRDDIILAPGTRLEKELSGGQVHTYKISVGAGQYLRVVVEQHGIIIMATLWDPAEKEVVKTDNPSGAFGPIYVSTISQSPGDHRLEIRSTEDWANPGRYKISIEHLREATPSDVERVAAEKSYVEGRHFFEGRAGPSDRKQRLKEASDKFETVLSYWRRVNDRHWIALTEFSLGVTHRALENWPVAAKHFDQSLEVPVDEFDWRLRASVFNDRGANFGYLRDDPKALESLKEALEIYKGHNDRRGWASALSNIGIQHLRSGRNRKAIEKFDEAMPLRKAENDRFGEAVLLNNKASAFNALGEPHEALKGYQEALKIWQELHKQKRLPNAVVTLARGFNNVALAYDRLGEWQKALENYEQSLALYGPDPPVAAAATFDNIGELYAVLGDSRAMDYYEKARLLAQGKDPRIEASVLNHIGELYLSQNKLTDALPRFERTLALREDPSLKANAHTNIGTVYLLQQNPRKALASYQSALQLIKEDEDRRGLAFTLQKVGEAHTLLKEPDKALEALNRALPIWRAVADQRGEAATLYTIALAERDRGNIAEALEQSRRSLNIIESLRTKVVSQRLRSSFFASQQSHYELYINLRMRLHQMDKSAEHLAAALQASEQSRARSLMETLNETHVNLYSGVSQGLIDEEQKAQQKINNKARAQMALLNGQHSKEQAADMEREVSQAVAEYDAVKAKIRASSPDYAQLTQPKSLSVGEIQELLDEETLLVQYFLGEEKSYLWLVSRTSPIFGVDSLPNRATIESTADAFYKSLTDPSSTLNNVRSANRSKKAAGPVQPVNAEALSQMLLGPIADRIGKRLLIVSDGVLQYLPFGALPVPRPQRETGLQSKQAGKAPYLIEEHEIVYLPSASTLNLLRSKANSRPPVPLSVAVLAYPVLSVEDERWKTAKQRPPSTEVVSLDKPSVPNLRDSRVQRSGLSPLPATEKEADDIKSVFHTYGRTETFKGFDASRDRVLKLQDDGFRILHFATHGIVDTDHPELSGIVLSEFDSNGKPQDGFLRLHQIYNLKLPADLIVLSACSTGLGQIIKGEGLISLTRGFMHAGSPRVIASLWRVEDLGTSELMKRFYQHLAKEGMAPSAALRQAQIEMIRHKRWNSPYHWAGFVLQGEWRPIR